MKKHHTGKKTIYLGIHKAGTIYFIDFVCCILLEDKIIQPKYQYNTTFLGQAQSL